MLKIEIQLQTAQQAKRLARKTMTIIGLVYALCALILFLYEKGSFITTGYFGLTRTTLIIPMVLSFAVAINVFSTENLFHSQHQNQLNEQSIITFNMTSSSIFQS